MENATGPCALGKKNWLFIEDVCAGLCTATFYSLLGSCLRRSVNPRDYLHWLFGRLPATMPKDHPALTPATYAAAQKPAAVEPLAA